MVGPLVYLGVFDFIWLLLSVDAATMVTLWFVCDVLFATIRVPLCVAVSTLLMLLLNCCCALSAIC